MMRILVIGANGFIGSSIVAASLQAGFEIRCAVRSPHPFNHRYPEIDTRPLDLTTDVAHDIEHWIILLDGIDAVINVAGVLQPGKPEEAWAVHHTAPETLFKACEQAGVRRVIQVSAIGVEESETTFARSKRAGDETLMAMNLDWTVLRPVVVVGDGSYGGTSLIRSLAVFPFVMPVVDDGAAPIDIIHKNDLAAGVMELLRNKTGIRMVLEPASSDRNTMLDVIAAYRNWFGLPRSPVFGIPNWLADIIASLGDMTRLHPVTTTSLTQIRERLTGNASEYERITGIKPSNLQTILSARPCETQDLWHARLFLLRPLIRMSLAFMWMVSGLIGLFGYSEMYKPIVEQVLPYDWGGAVTIIASLADLAVALALITGWRLALMAWVQVGLVATYTAVLGILAPLLWADPFGSLLKNITILVLLLVHRVVEEER